MKLIISTLSIFFNKYLQIVVLPAPEGDEIIIILLLISFKFFNFFAYIYSICLYVLDNFLKKHVYLIHCSKNNIKNHFYNFPELFQLFFFLHNILD